MRTTLLASATLMSMVLAVPVMAQSVSAPASNITPADTHSTIAPRLPVPPVSDNAGPRPFLQAASTALSANRTGEAEEALERAETALLDRSTPAGGQEVDRRPMVRQVSEAREALGHGDVARAQQIVNAALAGPSATVASTAPMSSPSAGMAAGATAGTPVVVGVAPVTAAFPETSTTGQVSVTLSGTDAMTETKTREGRVMNQGPGADTAQQ